MHQKYVFVSHWPYKRSHSPCATLHTVFINPDTRKASFEGYLGIKDDSDEEFVKKADKLVIPENNLLFNSFGSIGMSERSAYLLRLAILRNVKVTIYWHETAWNLRQFIQSNQSIFREVKFLLSFLNVTHWVPTNQNQTIICFLFGTPVENTRVVYEVVNLKKFKPFPRNKNSGNKIVIAGAGLPCERKGLDKFVTLAEKLKIINGIDVEFRWYSPNVKEQIPNSNNSKLYSNFIKYMGYSENFEQEFKEIDAFLMTSRDDPSPLVAFEALACNRPVFTFESNGIKDIVTSNFICSNEQEMEKAIMKYFLNFYAEYDEYFFRQSVETYNPENFLRRTCAANSTPVQFPDLKDSESYLESSFSSSFLDGIEKQIRKYKDHVIGDVPLMELNQMQHESIEKLRSKYALTGGSLKQRIYRALEWRFYKFLNIKRTKRAIIIGNSPEVLNKELGNYIDQFDEVIRINNFQINGFEKFVGKKTTRVFITPATHKSEYLNNFPKKRIYLFLANKHSKEHFKFVRKRMSLPEVGTGLCPHELNKLSPELYFYSLKSLIGLRKDQWPSTGLVSISWAIDNLSRSHEIYYYGFSFFKESGTDLEHYFPIKTKRDRHHDFKKEEVYVEKLLSKGMLNSL